MELKVICAWCKRTIQDPQTDQYPLEVRVSHGICPLCYECQQPLLDAMDPKLKHPDHLTDHGGEG